MRRGSAERVGGRTPMKSARTRPSAAAPPAALYQPSSREYTGTLPPVEYPGHFIVKRVTNAGTIRLKKRLLFIANALKQHPVGLEEVADGIWSIHFCNVLLGRSTNGTTSSGHRGKCYPCYRFILLPIFPVAHSQMPLPSATSQGIDRQRPRTAKDQRHQAGDV